eukprot:gnl/TRDRNA2_/TRDRNA2_161567_c2_seq1.p1 gnl/TRDRNA2_/TRDRNA2_161567_c2~~gnl/TRDRNA2_/TRDRNA2_161567_c2_seq1.p1  ORF type:complete len:235 (-),score=41.89 gnl/TRDRNA2_/TRDRNA2_161567_c2_seq1:209-913(-)
MAGIPPQRFDKDEIEQLRMYFPNATETLRACLRCRRIMAKDQFFQYGCPDCKETLNMMENEGRVLACTSAKFLGYIAVLRSGTFVGRFNGLEKRMPGMYALTVEGEIPDYILYEEDDDDIFADTGQRRPGDASAGASTADSDEDDKEETIVQKPSAKRPVDIAGDAEAQKRLRPADSEAERSSDQEKRPNVSGSGTESAAMRSDQTGASSRTAASSSTLILEPEGEREFARGAP